jgi:hypothetical protein
MVRSGLSKERPKQDYRLDIVGEFAALIDRIKSRGIVGMTLLSDPKGQRLKHSRDFCANPSWRGTAPRRSKQRGARNSSGATAMAPPYIKIEEFADP